MSTHPDRPLTAEQEAAVGARGHVAVRAGAGSGKTEVLAHRYLAVLEGAEGLGPATVQQILAITFTEKATADMKERIRTLLAERLAAVPRASEVGARLARAERDLAGAHISTIHSFCARLLRENPVEADLDPHVIVLDEREAATYEEGIVEEALRTALRRGDPGARWCLRRLGLRGGLHGSGSVQTCVHLLTNLATLGRDASWLLARAQSPHRLHSLARRLAAATSELRDIVDGLLASPPETLPKRAAKALAELGRSWSAWQGRLAVLGPPYRSDGLVGLQPLAECLARLSRHLGPPVGQRLATLLTASREGIGGDIPSLYGALASAPLARDLARLLAWLDGILRERRGDDGLATFQDLLVRARDLLAHNPDVRRRYQVRYRSVLVDEFQDTDPVQGEIIRLLARAGDGEGPDLFIVGDEKQSIYRFRGADVTVFRRVAQWTGQELPLRTSFRSVRPILDFVNAVGAVIMREATAPDEIAWAPEHRLTHHRDATTDEPCVELLTLAPLWYGPRGRRETVRAGDLRAAEARAIAARIASLHEAGRRYGEVAILLRVFSDVKVYEAALRRSEIPHYVVKGRGFFGCQEVADMVALLAAVDDPNDAIALAAVLRSPLFAVSDGGLFRLAANGQRPLAARLFDCRDRLADLGPDRQAALRARASLTELRGVRDRWTIAELLEEAMRRTDIEPVLLGTFQGQQKVANIRKFIELARDFEGRRLFTLRDFVRHAERLIEREPQEPEAQILGESEDVVRLMTVHQAKGLEFPVVIVPDLARGQKNPPGNFLLDSEEGLLVSDLVGPGAHPLPHAGIAALRSEEKRRDRAEASRLLYVALTRARDFLMLSEGPATMALLARASTDDPREPWLAAIWQTIGPERVRTFFEGSDESQVVRVQGAGGDVSVVLRRVAPQAPPRPAPRAARRAQPDAATLALCHARITFQPPAPQELATTPTALADFARCPRQHFFRHVLELPEHGLGTGGEEEARLAGTVAHGVLERIGPGLHGKALDEEIERCLGGLPQARRLSPAARSRVAEDLRRFLDQEPRHARIIGREVPFVLPAGRPPMIFIHGQIDLLAEAAEGITVSDYKYAEPRAGEVDYYALQMRLYGWAAASAYPGRPVRTELVFLRGAGGRVEVAMPPLDRVEAEAEALGAALLQDIGKWNRGSGPGTNGAPQGAFARGFEDPAPCRSLGCGFIARCWGRSSP